MIIRPSAVIVRDDHFLTMRYRYHGKVRYNLPGGNREDKESLWETLQRELQEELAIEVQEGYLLWVVQTQAGGREVLHLIFNVTSFANEPQMSAQQTHAEAIEWLNIDVLPALSLYPAVGSQLHAYLSSGCQVIGDPYLGIVHQEWY